MVDIEKTLTRLHELGADKVDHLNGDLAAHLKGTFDVLARWGNREHVCLAGLYHAVYGTDGLEIGVVGLEQRALIAESIGKKAEELVYIYAATDRLFFNQQIAESDRPLHRDRFTGLESTLSPSLLKGFCELTLANEIEITNNDPDHLRKYAFVFERLFDSNRFRSNLSKKALGEYLSMR